MSCKVSSGSAAMESINCLGCKLLISAELEVCDCGMVGVTHGSVMLGGDLIKGIRPGELSGGE